MRETIKNLKFVKTCDACPEQYDVYQGDKKVAYIRLRWVHYVLEPMKIMRLVTR